MANELEPLTPADGRQMYLNERRHEVSEATLQSHGYRLDQFVEWCDDQGIDNLNDLSGRDIHRFRVKRREEDGLSTPSMKGQLSTLRMFLRFCASIDAVESGLDEKITLPTTTREDAREEMLSSDRAEQILSHLNKFEYATLEHVLFEVLWNTGLRIGAVVGLDVRDYDADDQLLELVHRPEEGTRLKNGAMSERYIALSERVADVLDDWLETNHPGIEDEDGRRPLFATSSNRLSRNHARALTYRITSPCEYSSECPHDREVDECEARTTSKAYACPSSLSPHPIRRGAITYYLRNDTPVRAVSDRMDVGESTLSRHYDQRTAREKVEQRRRYLPDEDFSN